MFCVFLYLFILYCCVSTVVFSFLMNPRPPRTTRTHPRFPYNDALPISGQTLNVMTLSGLALAIGILVDDATVTIENINWHLENGKPVLRSFLDGAAQLVTPAFVSLLCICIVFVPMFFLLGVAGFLFVPLALSVVFAMVMSFILSRTLVQHKIGRAHV